MPLSGSSLASAQAPARPDSGTSRRAKPSRAARPTLAERIDVFAGKHSRRQSSQNGERLLTQRSVYILPSRPGMLYGVVLMTMLIASINYRLSLGYALTFLLAGAAIVGMLQTFRNLSKLLLRSGKAEAVFAGQIAEFSVIITNKNRIPRYAIHVQTPGMAKDTVFDLAPFAEHIGSVALTTTERGWHPLPRLKLRTTFPLGIWTAWAYWYPAMNVLVYPTPENPSVPLPEQRNASHSGQSYGNGDEDVAGIRPYQAGDAPKRIAWKAIARAGSDVLLSKQLEGGAQGDLALDWYNLPLALDPEGRLSRLTRWVIEADTLAARYSLRLPGLEIESGSGAEHRQRCLLALAEAKV